MKLIILRINEELTFSDNNTFKMLSLKEPLRIASFRLIVYSIRCYILYEDDDNYKVQNQ